MGLHIQTLDAIPADAGRKYFIYLLDYGWEEPLVNTLMQNFTNMARMASDSDAVVIAGISPVHFANDVFSWHGINGEDGEAILPAIMITSLHPTYFIENQNGARGEISDKLIIIPLKKACKTTDDVIKLIQSIFKDIKGGGAPMSFSVAKEMKKEEHGRFADSLLLEPNFAGVGVRLPQLLQWLVKKK
ncbi:MAG: hypothetical protein H0X66_02300 [Verrucomicrobia bacterium]|nr:hypothetical protein [Verrucomicrobiota bacterium]